MGDSAQDLSEKEMQRGEACVRAKLLPSCPTLCGHVDCGPPGSSVHGDSPGKNTGVGCHAYPQGIFLTQGSKLHLMFSALADGFLTTSATWEAQIYVYVWPSHFAVQ